MKISLGSFLMWIATNRFWMVKGVDFKNICGAYADSIEDFQLLAKIIFGFDRFISGMPRQVIDFTAYKEKCISDDQMESAYNRYLETSSAETSMDQYGNFCEIAYFFNQQRSSKRIYGLLEQRVSTVDHNFA